MYADDFRHCVNVAGVTFSSSNRYHYRIHKMNENPPRQEVGGSNGTHLVLEPSKVGVMPVIDLSFVTDYCKEVVFVHRVRTGISLESADRGQFCAPRRGW